MESASNLMLTRREALAAATAVSLLSGSASWAKTVYSDKQYASAIVIDSLGVRVVLSPGSSMTRPFYPSL